MAIIQAFSNFGLIMNLADPLGFNTGSDGVPITANGSTVAFRTIDGGTLTATGSGFGGFEGPDSGLTGTVTAMTRQSSDGSTLFSINDLSFSLREFALTTNSESNPNYGLTFFSAIGTGADVVNGSDGQADVVFSFNGNDTVRGFGGNDLIYGNKQDDQLFGGTGADTLFGGQQRDVVAGDAGDDLLYGNFNEDTMFGGDGNDTLFGGQSDDIINGEGGNDLIFANRGNDTMSGGAGADEFVFGFQQQQGNNVINDFNAADDRITINGAVANGTTISFDAGANATVIATATIYDQGQFLRQDDGSLIFESAGQANNFITLLGGDFTAQVGVSIFFN